MELLIEKNNSNFINGNFFIDIGVLSEISNNRDDAHLIEHLIFHGHNNANQNEIFSFFEQYGGIINAEVSWSHTCIYFRIDKKYIDTALEYIYQCITNFNITIENYLNEIKIINVENKELNQDLPYNAIDLTVFRNFSNKTQGFSNFDELNNKYRQYYDEKYWKILLIGNIEEFDLTNINKNISLASEPRTIKSSLNVKKKELIFNTLNDMNYFTLIVPVNEDEILIKMIQKYYFDGFLTSIYQHLVQETAICYSLYSTIINCSNNSYIIIFSPYSGDKHTIEKYLKHFNFYDDIKNITNLQLESLAQKTLSYYFLKCETTGGLANLIIDFLINMNKSINLSTIESKINNLDLIQVKNKLLETSLKLTSYN